jgi:hypothetical protein
MVLAPSSLELHTTEDEHFIDGLELKLRSSSWRFLGFAFVCSGGRRWRLLLGTERPENIKELLDMLSSHNLWLWLVRQKS